MDKVCVLIRVYNRVEDLKYCLEIIRDSWKENDYYIMVVANGEKDGYVIDKESQKKADRFISLQANTGHFTGNSQLLLEGLNSIPDYCAYTIILEADTWLYGDAIISKYIKQLKEQKAVWASAQFFSFVNNLATDFAIVDTSFLKTHREVFTFAGTPEYYVANYLDEHKQGYLYIKELMPVNTPRYIRKFPYAPTGRFFAFPAGKMVTHHIESLESGMDEKKFHFNVVANKEYFKIGYQHSYPWTRLKMRFFMALSYLFPYKGWFVKKKKSWN